MKVDEGSADAVTEQQSLAAFQVIILVCDEDCSRTAPGKRLHVENILEYLASYPQP